MCNTCNGDGMVRILHPALVKCVAMGIEKTKYMTSKGERVYKRDDSLGRLNLSTCEIPCHCPAGDRMAIWSHSDGSSQMLTRFSDSRFHVRSVPMRADFHDRKIWDQAVVDAIFGAGLSPRDPEDNEFNRALENNG